MAPLSWPLLPLMSASPNMRVATLACMAESTAWPDSDRFSITFQTHGSSSSLLRSESISRCGHFTRISFQIPFRPSDRVSYPHQFSNFIRLHELIQVSTNWCCVLRSRFVVLKYMSLWANQPAVTDVAYQIKIDVYQQILCITKWCVLKQRWCISKKSCCVSKKEMLYITLKEDVYVTTDFVY